MPHTKFRVLGHSDAPELPTPCPAHNQNQVDRAVGTGGVPLAREVRQPPLSVSLLLVGEAVWRMREAHTRREAWAGGQSIKGQPRTLSAPLPRVF